MGRKKEKKKNPKRERYLKFRKDKSSILDISMPDLDDEQARRKREDDEKISRYLKFSKNPPVKEIVERRMKSKR